eukprot:Skav200621  [mRNA]  locus=scaffold2029:53367:55343:+ [translate_table: standard]
MAGVRGDKICWVNYEGLDREKQPGLLELFKQMISIPFELNKKCSLYLQASGSFQLASYPAEAPYRSTAFYKKHMDGGYDALNNGRKANKDWSASDGGWVRSWRQLRLYKRRPNPFQVEKGAVETTVDEAMERV